MFSKTPCPDREALQRLLLGRLPPTDVEPLYCHLEECDRCTEAARSLPGDDWLPAALRSLPGAGKPDAGALDLVESLRRNGPPRPAPSSKGDYAVEAVTASEGSTPDKAADRRQYDFLRPAQEADELGRLGGCRVLSVLGQGGMGVVFRAEDPILRRPVALKAMLPGLAASDSSRRRFLREGRAAAAASHDHIVPIYQVGEDRGVPFIAMPLLSGESLEDRLRREKALPLVEGLRIGREVAEGLAAAHARGLIHRDVKPANIWLETRTSEPGPSVPEVRVRILDFGLVRDAADAQLTGEGVVVGTPAFMAPEQAHGGEVDARTDLFSLGCVLYRMATGEMPFRGRDALATLMAVAADHPRPPARVNRAVPPALSALVMRLLAKDPAGRPASAREVVEQLEAVEAALSRPRKRFRWPAAALLGALVIAAAAMALHLSVQTEQGVIDIDSDDPNVKIVVERAGKVVKVIDGKSNATYRFDPGDYNVRLDGNLDGLVVQMPAGPFTLTRDGRKIVRIRRTPVEPPERVGDKVFLEGYDDVVWGAAFSPDGRYTLTTGRKNLLRRRPDNRIVRRLGASVWFAAFSPDSKYALTGDMTTRAVVLWNVETGREVRRFAAPGGRVFNGIFSADGRRIATTHDDTACVWDVATGRRLMTAPTQHDSRPALAFTPDGRRLLVIHSDLRSVRRYDVESGKEVEPRLACPDEVIALALSADGATALTVDNHDADVLVWDATTGMLLRRLRSGQKLRDANHRQVAFLPDGRRAVVTNFDGAIILWDVATGKEMQRWEDQGKIVSLAISPDGRHALCGRWDFDAFLMRLPVPVAAP